METFSNDLEARRAAAIARLEQYGNHEADATSVVCTAKTNETLASTSVEDENFFRGLTWSLDGSMLHTIRANKTIETYEISSSLLTPATDAEDVATLKPRSYHRTPTNVYAIAVPSINNAGPYLVSCADIPIRLVSPSSTHPQASTDPVVAQYPLIHTETEAHQPAYSLLPFSGTTKWIADDMASEPAAQDDHFWAGSDASLSLFDLTRPGGCPTRTLRTGANSRARKKGIVADVDSVVHGPVSALALSAGNLLAGGTYHRCIGLYDSRGAGGVVSTWSLSNPLQNQFQRGTGVTSLRFSVDGNYLYVAERMACAIQVWDMRTLQRLGFLGGREALTQQRMDVAHVPTQNVQGGASEILAMGTSGNVQVYHNPNFSTENDVVYPSQTLNVHNECAGAIAPHPFICKAIATASGQRHFRLPWDGQDSGDSPGRPERYEGSYEVAESVNKTEPRASKCQLKIWWKP